MLSLRDGAITPAEQLVRLIALVDAHPGALAAHLAGSLKAAAMREHRSSGQADPFKAAIRRISIWKYLRKRRRSLWMRIEANLTTGLRENSVLGLP